MSKKLNRGKCANCGDVIVSRHQHDFQVCSCFRDSEPNTGIFVDGGDAYQRIGGNLKNFLVFKNRKWVPIKLENKENNPTNLFWKLFRYWRNKK